MATEWDEVLAGGASLKVTLPRVVADGGRVGHILIGASAIWTLRKNGPFWYRHGRRRRYVGDTACHAVEVTPHWRWATADDPTCKRCLKALQSHIGAVLA